MFGSSAPDDWKGCSEIAMLDRIADVRDIYGLPYWQGASNFWKAQQCNVQNKFWAECHLAGRSMTQGSKSKHYKWCEKQTIQGLEPIGDWAANRHFELTKSERQQERLAANMADFNLILLLIMVCITWPNISVVLGGAWHHCGVESVFKLAKPQKAAATLMQGSATCLSRMDTIGKWTWSTRWLEA
jgi:hypothetical protein